MATITCQTCGAVWNDELPNQSSKYFTTPTLNGRVVGLDEVILSGESLLTCPKDPREPLDTAIHEEFNSSKSRARVTGFRNGREELDE